LHVPTRSRKEGLHSWALCLVGETGSRRVQEPAIPAATPAPAPELLPSAAKKPLRRKNLRSGLTYLLRLARAHSISPRATLHADKTTLATCIPIVPFGYWDHYRELDSHGNADDSRSLGLARDSAQGLNRVPRRKHACPSTCLTRVPVELLLGRRTVIVAVRGLAFGDRTASTRRLRVADTVDLEREPENPFDANAIRVRLVDGAEVGYVAREAARELAAHLDADPHAFEATVREVDADGGLLRLEITPR